MNNMSVSIWWIMSSIIVLHKGQKSNLRFIFPDIIDGTNIGPAQKRLSKKKKKYNHQQP